MFEISTAPIDTERLARELANPRAGAMVAFEGWVRNHHDGNPVQHLEYEAFEEMARTTGNAILEEARKRFGILAARVAHRAGTVHIGERAIWVGVTAEHRQEAFLACRWIMDQIKQDVPVWKMETYRDNREPAWVHAGISSASTDADPPARPDAAFPEMGKEERRKLAEARVLVIGVGVTGCPALQYLATAGIGMLTIVDGERVEESRLHREILFGIQDLGRNKAEAAADRLRVLNPQLAVRSVLGAAMPGRLAGLLAGQDVVLDGADSWESRYAIHDACRDSGIVLIQAGIDGENGFIHVIDPATRAGCLRCLWPAPPTVDHAGRGARSAISGIAAGMLGAWQAAETLKILLDQPGALRDATLLMDLQSGETRRIPRAPREGCVCRGGRV